MALTSRPRSKSVFMLFEYVVNLINKHFKSQKCLKKNTIFITFLSKKKIPFFLNICEILQQNIRIFYIFDKSSRIIESSNILKITLEYLQFNTLLKYFTYFSKKMVIFLDKENYKNNN